MGLTVLVVGVILAVVVLGAAFQPQAQGYRKPGVVLAIIILVVALLLSSTRHISATEVGIVVKNMGVKTLKGGAYIATSGEQGIQAEVLEPGWHLGFWPFVYDVREVALTDVPSGSVGIVEARDGQALPPGQVVAPEIGPLEFQKLVLNAREFLTGGKGFRGTQANVLTPGKYRLNTELFSVSMVQMTEVAAGEVAVLKANFGTPPSLSTRAGLASAASPGATPPAAPAPGTTPTLEAPKGDDRVLLAKSGEMGIRADVLPPGKYAINTQAYAVVEIWTTQMIAHFTKGRASNPVSTGTGDASQEEREITVRTSDGFTFPVDVRIEYEIEPRNAPVVVALLGDDESERFRNTLNSAVRAIFRNNAENVKALDYVQQRSIQESQSLTMLKQQMAKFGVTVNAVRIGNVGDEQSLGTLLKTQTDREIAKQELLTSVEQQKAAAQKKELSRTTQESEEEKKLATATYAVKIAEQTQKQKLVEAESEAQATKIRSMAQAEAYKQIAEQIGKSNAALIELLKIVGERNIQITPRVLITGGGGGGADGGLSGHNAALMGTILDTMVKDEPASPGSAAPGSPKK